MTETSDYSEEERDLILCTTRRQTCKVGDCRTCGWNKKPDAIKQMTETLREGLVHWLAHNDHLSDQHISPPISDSVDQIISIFQSHDWVELDKKQELPLPHGTYMSPRMAEPHSADYTLAQEDMLKAGWRKVKIPEGK